VLSRRPEIYRIAYSESAGLWAVARPQSLCASACFLGRLNTEINVPLQALRIWNINVAAHTRLATQTRTVTLRSRTARRQGDEEKMVILTGPPSNAAHRGTVTAVCQVTRVRSGFQSRR
jgi:hypothetical protein